MSKGPQSTAEIREAFQKYFEKNGHTRVESSKTFPEGDPTLLFTNAGMNQFKDVFLGLDPRAYTRATSAQKCVRAGGKHNDLDNVGFTERHHTFFEMMGNFSFGDYFKKEAIRFAWEFVTQELALPKEKLAVSVYEKDDEAYAIWRDQEGVPEERIFRFGEEDNFWQMGDTGPCGPCSEIFWDQGKEVDGERWLEFWNCVFMQYDRKKGGELVPLERPCVDTGMGLERIATILQGKESNYEIDLFEELLSATQSYFEAKTQRKIDRNEHKSKTALRVIVDHLRSTSFLIADGVLPSNEGRGYVLRRILRRAIRFGTSLGLHEAFLCELYPYLMKSMGSAYPELVERETVVREILKQEEEKFLETLDRGIQLLEKSLEQVQNGQLPAKVVFKLYDSFGFPFDLTEVILKEKGLSFDQSAVNELMKVQQDRSRASWKGSGAESIPRQVKEWKGREIFPRPTFYQSHQERAQVLAKEVTEQGAWVAIDPCPFYAESGGQIGDRGVLKLDNGQELRVVGTKKPYPGGMALFIEGDVSSLEVGQLLEAQVDDELRQLARSNHTATHLIHAALRKHLGDHVQQAGSYLDHERLRFDFSHGQSISKQSLEAIEQEVNQAVAQNVAVEVSVKSFDEAKGAGAMALFGEKYGDEVRVVNIPGLSMELCGGLHVEKTGEIELVKILMESGVAAGTRRIEAISNKAAIEFLEEQNARVTRLSNKLSVPTSELEARVDKLLDRQKELEKEIQSLEQRLARGSVEEESFEILFEGTPVLIHVVEGLAPKLLRDKGDLLRQKEAQKAHVIWSGDNVLVTADTKKLSSFHSGNFLKKLALEFKGKGGGQDKTAQGKIPLPQNLEERLQKVFA